MATIKIDEETNKKYKKSFDTIKTILLEHSKENEAFDGLELEKLISTKAEEMSIDLSCINTSSVTKRLWNSAHNHLDLTIRHINNMHLPDAKYKWQNIKIKFEKSLKETKKNFDAKRSDIDKNPEMIEKLKETEAGIQKALYDSAKKEMDDAKKSFVLRQVENLKSNLLEQLEIVLKKSCTGPAVYVNNGNYDLTMPETDLGNKMEL